MNNVEKLNTAYYCHVVGGKVERAFGTRFPSKKHSIMIKRLLEWKCYHDSIFVQATNGDMLFCRSRGDGTYTELQSLDRLAARFW